MNDEIRAVFGKIKKFDEEVNKIQSKQLEFDSELKNHGHGNKNAIDNLFSNLEAISTWKKRITNDLSVKPSKF